MRTVIMLSFVALLVASVSASATEPVAISGDFGVGWLASQPERISTGAGGGLWTWGDTPSGYTAVNGSLVPVVNGTSQTDQTGIEWLGSAPPNASKIYFNPSGYIDYGYPFYSDDAWVLAQHYGITVTTPLSYLPQEQQDQIRQELKDQKQL